MSDATSTTRLSRGLERALLFMLYAVPLTVTWAEAAEPRVRAAARLTAWMTLHRFPAG